MYYDHCEWDDEDDADGNTAHIAEHEVSREEVEDVLEAAREADVFPSRSSGRPSVIGDTAEGRTLFVTFIRTDDGGFILVRPVTAYDA